MVLSLDKRTLYLGGEFTAVNSVGRSRLAAVTTPLATGCAAWRRATSVTGWDPDPSNDVNALAFASAKDGGDAYIFAAGAFSTLNGGTVLRRKIARIRTTDTGTVVAELGRGRERRGDAACADRLRPSVYVGGADMTTSAAPRAQEPRRGRFDDRPGDDLGPEPERHRAVHEVRRRAIFDDVSVSEQLPTLFVGGGFTQIGNPPKNRPGAAEIGTSDDGGATPWNPAIRAARPHTTSSR